MGQAPPRRFLPTPDWAPGTKIIDWHSGLEAREDFGSNWNEPGKPFTGSHPGLEARRSTLNTTTKKRARTPFETVREAGDGLFTKRAYQPHEHVLDYAYQSGRTGHGPKVDVMTKAQHDAKYPPTELNPLGTGTHVKLAGTSHYYDTASSGGLGGKANTNPGKQTAYWDGRHIKAGASGLSKGQEVFVPYASGYGSKGAYQFQTSRDHTGGGAPLDITDISEPRGHGRRDPLEWHVHKGMSAAQSDRALSRDPFIERWKNEPPRGV